MKNNDLQNFIDTLSIVSDVYSELQTKNDMLNDMHALSDEEAKENKLLLDGLIQLEKLIKDIENKRK